MAHSSYTFANDEIVAFREDLLRWYDINKRDLPWRRVCPGTNINQHAYSVWVSEIMLQQTRVATVIDYYTRWMKKWPNVEALSKSSEEEVNEMWAGLGYYSRGRRLREGALKVVNSLGGKMPSDSSKLMSQLPGVGRYTAAAIASIAFDEACGVLDGNVIRVLCRLQCIGGNSTSKDVQAHLWRLCNDVVDCKRPGDFNQAIMELGAMVCLPKGPKCSQCPVNSICKAYRQVEAHKNLQKLKLKQEVCSAETETDADVKIKHENTTTDIEDCANTFLALPASTVWDPELGVMNYPQKPPKKPPRSENIVVLALELFKDTEENLARWLIAQRPKTGLLAGLWEFPNEPIAADPHQHNKENKTKKRRRVSGENENSEFKSDDIITISRLLFSKICTTELGDNIQTNHVGSFVHIFSHIHQTNHVVHVRANAQAESLNLSKDRNFRFVTANELKESAISSSVLKVLKLCQENNSQKCKSSSTSSKKRRNGQRCIETFFAPASKK